MLMLSHTTQQRAHQLPQRKPMTPQLQEQVTVQLQDPEMEPEVQVQEQVLLTEQYESANEGWTYILISEGYPAHIITW